jgi:hypothetical protein
VGANQFVYGENGDINIVIRIKVPGISTRVSQTDKDKIRVNVDPIGESEKIWGDFYPDGKPTISEGDWVMAFVTFRGLPTKNSDFGRKKVWVEYDGKREPFEQAFEVFYPRDLKNHPGEGSGVSPNWFYYWSQTSANNATGIKMQYNPRAVPTGSSGRYYLHDFAIRRLETIYISDEAKNRQIAAWGEPVGIDSFAWTTAHEAKHHRQLTGFWPNIWNSDLDNDKGVGDLLPDAIEATYMPDHPYKPTELRTYKDTLGYNSREAMIPDWEDICMRSQSSPYDLDVLWRNGNANAEDWSDKGKQCKKQH